MALLCACLVLGRSLESHSRFQDDQNIDEISNEFQLFRPDTISLEASTTDMYQITDISPTQITDGDVVTVYFNTSNPSSGDFIAAYAPASKIFNVTSTTPLKFGYCDESLNYNITGVGSLRFNMTNTRTDIGFVYYSNNTKYPILQNHSTTIVTFSNLNAPLRPRVVASGNPDQLNLVWSSLNSSTPVMKWGLSPGAYDTTSTANTTSVNRSKLCGAPATTIGTHSCELVLLSVDYNSYLKFLLCYLLYPWLYYYYIIM